MNDATAWPLFDLVVTTPKLELRYATDALLLELTGMAYDVIPPGSLPFEEGATFYDMSTTGRQRWLAGQWSARSRTSPEWWVLVFAVVVEGRAVGTQEVTAVNFSALRTVNTFSWLNRAYQGSGLGKEMRAAVLHLAFEGLGAHRATSEAFEDNLASCGVSRALGYADDGITWALRGDGQAGPMRRFMLTRDDWYRGRRSDISISGLVPCLPLLGLS
jgi:RimJ/RimL family protein N-acetyltransferase